MVIIWDSPEPLQIEQDAEKDARKGTERKTGNLSGRYEMSLEAWNKAKPANRAKDSKGNEIEGVLIDAKQEQYKVWEMHVLATVAGELTGLCLPGRDRSNPKAPVPGFKVSSFQEIAEIDCGDKGWKARLLPLAEFLPP